jgi:hypothetical protein
VTPTERVFAATLATLSFGFTGGSAGAVSLPLQSHVAVYDVSLARSEDRLGLSSVRGRLVLELAGSDCSDWTVNFRMVSQFVSEDQSVRLLDTQSSTWESGSSRELRVTQRHFVDNALDTEAQVGATIETSGRVHGQVEQPEGQEFELARGTIFPIAHLKKLVTAADGNQRRDKSVVFDGSEGSKAYTAISFIGPRHKPAKQLTGLKTGDAATLSGITAWPVAISFYDPDDGKHVEGTPSYQMQFEMFANGVSGDMTIDYGDYALKADLAKLEYGKPEVCR